MLINYINYLYHIVRVTHLLHRDAIIHYFFLFFFLFVLRRYFFRNTYLRFIYNSVLSVFA